MTESIRQDGTPRPVRVAVIGMGWMGRVHAQAYARVSHHYPEGPARAVLVALADDVSGRAAQFAEQFGAERAYTDWREVVADPAVEAVSVTAPNFLHREIGTAVLAAGKHLWIEKPVGLTADDARAVADAATAAGRMTAVGFNYRNAPAVRAARDLIADGAIGAVTHARFRFFSDYAAHPDGALTWRYQRDRGGNGVLGDLGSHGVDLVRHLLGDIDALVADSAVFIPERAVPAGATSGHQRVAAGGARGRVENDDYAAAQLRLASGARCVVEASRVAVGEQNSYGFEVHGTSGMVRWDYRRMGELETSLGSAYQDQSVSTVYIGPGSGDFAAFQPGAANPMSYDDLKVIEAQCFLRSIVTGVPEGATAADAVYSARVVDAMTESVAAGRWVSL
ncbi:Oxidoreductase domain protein OS=Tsukamurella paurometabola (strain ATCC 8368 / DSM / CCUG 35730/ CIP 100753 / JCM 10117 / KCTC 9821 / NBRC 16120 / NCIMB 702349 / NCTC 13040) OX=521096 GN=Tpau_1357 PE=4 SV=1 [Tsukamurella paurometabola]|uniref:Oxidoreductase domain protein n=1 Tax=Tsukamurella paurometabola (strain ATCC 8368 / DSM 20162 / CCUG 35730 / CIP 100753 / JCM 10117 / KCTC 9821 / NBRC 16120 / NCIMB 702349 / NCTC 13040) TaxID=521096 RepID=D5UWW4_TSUPD|nr:Gfo/Idh/MocA family oxidoreductase [Tsukamurella paurometabola]ADG77986.1 oxidoreductase domain protein [Tsukamurella paurometabola DSM 20162]SUP29650.1 1,5-anhydro-D-fructose reductase [Tsukamurella paurometabola]